MSNESQVRVPTPDGIEVFKLLMPKVSYLKDVRMEPHKADLDITDFTCCNCSAIKKMGLGDELQVEHSAAGKVIDGICPFAYDLYNTGGDCLADK